MHTLATSTHAMQCPPGIHSIDRLLQMLHGCGCIACLFAAGLDPVDVLLLMAASENDTPKVEELLAAGANINIADNNGKSPLDLATKAEVKDLLEVRRTLCAWHAASLALRLCFPSMHQIQPATIIACRAAHTVCSA